MNFIQGVDESDHTFGPRREIEKLQVRRSLDRNNS
jgi:hypothetical protein